MTDPNMHHCEEYLESVNPGHDGEVAIYRICDYKTKNRDKMRVHLRTKHNIYYCGYCRKRWSGAQGQKQMWKRHMEARKNGTCI